MRVSVADLVLDRVQEGLDDPAPAGDDRGVFDTVADLLQSRLVHAVPGHGKAYLKRLISVLDTPLARILVTGWRTFEEFMRFAPAPGDARGGSGEVDLFDYETMARWEIAPRFEGARIQGPRLIVGMTLAMKSSTVVIRDGHFTGLKAATLRYDAVLQVKEAPKEIARVPPRRIELPGGRLDFGDGWPIRPFEQGRLD